MIERFEFFKNKNKVEYIKINWGAIFYIGEIILGRLYWGAIFFYRSSLFFQPFSVNGNSV